MNDRPLLRSHTQQVYAPRSHRNLTRSAQMKIDMRWQKASLRRKADSAPWILRIESVSDFQHMIYVDRTFYCLHKRASMLILWIYIVDKMNKTMTLCSRTILPADTAGFQCRGDGYMAHLLLFLTVLVKQIGTTPMKRDRTPPLSKSCSKRHLRLIPGSFICFLNVEPNKFPPGTD